MNSASSWGKVESGVNPPPGDVDVLERLSDFFGLTPADRLALIDEAAIQRREIPEDVAGNVILQRALPVFFCATLGHNLTPKELKSLAAGIKKLHMPYRK